jgi:hypothetical protein
MICAPCEYEAKIVEAKKDCDYAPGNAGQYRREIAGKRGSKSNAKNKGPARGDNRTGLAILALGWMGARAEYSLGGFPAPTSVRRQQCGPRSK